MKKLLTILFLSLKLFADNLVIGTTSGYAPFVSLDPQGKYEGFDIDIAELVAQKLDCKLVIKDLGSMPSLMLALKQKKVDALIWAISITEERQKKLDMVYYQGDKIVEMPCLFWGETPDIRSMEDLAKDPKKIVCVEAGSFQEEVLKKIPGISLKYIDKLTDAVMEIKMGKSFATLIDPSLVAKFKAQYPNVKVLNLPLPSSSQSLGNGICINKTDTKLSFEVRKAIAELTAEGKISELEKKWGLQ